LMSNANVNPQSVAVLMHPKVWKQFADLEDTTGQPLMRPKELQAFLCAKFVPLVPKCFFWHRWRCGTSGTSLAQVFSCKALKNNTL